jgi:hypothetical protein
VNFSGAAGDNTAGWLVGWIQAQWIETSWGYYRGQSSNHGSEFHQRARPPARPAQACRDTLGPAADIFYDTGFGLRASLSGGAAFPRTVTVEFHDTPSEGDPISVNNALTQQPNFLREVQLELHICTVLVAKDPSGVFHQLKHIYWNLRWQYRFTPTAFPPGRATLTVAPIASGIGSDVSRVFSGAATDRRFAHVLTSPQVCNCNQFADGARMSPNIRRLRVWENFDVRS